MLLQNNQPIKTDIAQIYFICILGRQFDKDGNLVQWWSDSVIEAFKGKAQCIIDQYSNYTVEEVSMNVSIVANATSIVYDYSLCINQ